MRSLSFRGLRLGQVAIGVKRKYVSGGRNSLWWWDMDERAGVLIMFY